VDIIGVIKKLLGFGEPDPAQVEANYFAKAIVRELNRMGKCYVKKTKEQDIFQEVRFKPPLKVLPDRIELEVDAANLPYGISLSELKDAKIMEGLEAVCKRPVMIKHNRGAGFWYVIRRVNVEKKIFAYTDLRPPVTYDPTKAPLLIPIGRDDNGNQVWRDMEKIYHLLIGGSTGKGKTSLLHSIICWLIQHAPPTHVQLALIDLKEGLDFHRYNGVPHLVKPVAIQPEAAHELLGWVNEEISRRGKLFLTVNAENIETYRRRTGEFLNNIILIFDEITNLNKLKLLGQPEKETEAWFWLRDGAQRARALGIHFIISTQRPSVKVIDGDIKMNFTARIGLGTATDTDSRVILDNELATGLEIGDLIYQDSGNRGVQLRGPFIKTEQADKIVAAVIKNYGYESRRSAREAELSAQKRQALIERMLAYAVEKLEGRFAIEPLFEAFGKEITAADLKIIARELEEQGILAPAKGPKPRTVVGCRMSDDKMIGTAPPLTPLNGNHTEKNPPTDNFLR
jgi:DNA segregation ATPase FtsK/SpoIIIE-like protein